MRILVLVVFLFIGMLWLLSAPGPAHLQSSENFQRFLNGQKTSRAVVMVYAPWCGYCTMMKKRLRGLSGVSLVHHESPLGKTMKVQAFPTLFVYDCKTGRRISTHEGALSRDQVQSLLSP